MRSMAGRDARGRDTRGSGHGRGHGADEDGTPEARPDGEGKDSTGPRMTEVADEEAEGGRGRGGSRTTGFLSS